MKQDVKQALAIALIMEIGNEWRWIDENFYQRFIELREDENRKQWSDEEEMVYERLKSGQLEICD